MRIGISLLASPLREEVQTLLNVNTLTACLVPRGSLLNRSRALRFRHNQVGETERNVEGAFEEARRRVHLTDDIIPGAFGPIEVSGVGTIGGDTNQGNLTGGGTSGRTSDAGHKIDTCAVTTSRSVVEILALDGGEKSVIARLHAHSREKRMIERLISFQLVGTTRNVA